MAQPEIIKDIDARVKKSGDTMTGNLQGKYFQGTWLQTTDISDLNSSSSKIAVIRNDGWIYYRTPSELASDIGLTGNYVLKSGDTMTGNLTAPKFIGQLQGNASSSTYSTYTCFQDTRNVNEMPLDMLKGISLHLKLNSTDGLNDGLSYHPVLMLRDWNDLSGGPFAELAITGNQNLYFRSSTTNADNTWNPWRKVLTDYNYTSILNNTYLPLTGGTLTGTLKFSDSNGIQTRHIDGESTTFRGDLYLNYSVNAPIHVGHGGTYTISADGSYYSGTSAGATKLNSIRTINGNTHAQALQNEFNNYKASIPRNCLINYYSSAYGNGSQYMGYFLSGYDSNPYGGFFVAHYDTPYYVGISSGNFVQSRLWKSGDSVTGAVWNDYAECREADTIEPGYVLVETGDDSLTKSTERLSPFAGVSSDTWGFSQGETDKAKTPIAVAGRVLVYPWQDRNNYKPGDCVCAAPEGKVDIMTREEIIQYPDRIVGTVSSVPAYDKWGGGENADREPVNVNGRIWIKVR